MKDDQMQKWQTMCLTHTKKGCKWNDMPIHTHYQYITCLTLLSWLMTSYMIHYIKYTHFKMHTQLHMMKYICIHPPVFIQSWLKFTPLGKSKTWGKCVPRKKYTKYNIKGKLKKKTQEYILQGLQEIQTKLVVHKQKNKTPNQNITYNPHNTYTM